MFHDIQIIIITNFVVVSSVGIKRVHCSFPVCFPTNLASSKKWCTPKRNNVFPFRPKQSKTIWIGLTPLRVYHIPYYTIYKEVPIVTISIILVLVYERELHLKFNVFKTDGILFQINPLS